MERLYTSKARVEIPSSDISPDAAGSHSIRHGIGTLSVSFLTPGALGRPKLPAWKRLSGRESRRSPVRGPLSCR